MQIPLSQGKVAVVDAGDYENLCGYNWFARRSGNTFYAHRSQDGTIIAMHREILKPPAGLMCDHKDHNGLNNTRNNLRLCTAAQNQYNQRPQTGGTSKYKGVYWDENRRKWRAEIGYGGRLIHIGRFDYETDAAIAYDDRAIELFGEFAFLNCQCRPEIKKWIEETYLAYSV